jgi:surfactin synthase thioesterase subunit
LALNFSESTGQIRITNLFKTESGDLQFMDNTGVCNDWVQQNPAHPIAAFRLFCFPHAGGGSMIFRCWKNELKNVEICPVELPGRGRRFRDAPYTNLLALVRTLSEVLDFSVPYALFGHSMGALIAFELAREVRRKAYTTPTHLFVSGCVAPQMIRQLNRPRHLLPDTELLDELRLLNGTPEEVLGDSSLIQVFLPVLRADFAVVETYKYRSELPLDCPIVAFGGEQDEEINRLSLQGWSEHTQRGFAMGMFPGGHFFVQSARGSVLAEISKRLKSQSHLSRA